MSKASLETYILPSQVAKHNGENDCWVSFHGKVCDLTQLLAQNRGPLCEPIIRYAGTDISHWFDTSLNVRTCVCPESGRNISYIPQGRFLHLIPDVPCSDWQVVDKPWWKDDKLVIGKLSAKPGYIRVINTLSGQNDLLEVCMEEKLTQIAARYRAFNDNIGNYEWKRLGRPLDMDLTLEDNEVTPNQDEYGHITAGNEDIYVPAIHLYYKDLC